MRLYFLGTAAAEGYPALFCNCANCQAARTEGGRSLRMRSALLVNDDLLIDCGPDLLASALRFNRNLSRARTMLVTHAHEDHLMPFNLQMRREPFAKGPGVPTMALFGPRDVVDALAKACPDPGMMRLETHTVHAGETWENGGYTIHAYRANHALDHHEALFYSVEDGQRSFLYACDTGPFLDETWQALEGRSFDTIIMEETMGSGSYAQHIGFAEFFAQAMRMRESGILRLGGRLIAQHFSHVANPTHAGLEAILGPHGVEVAYDGLEVNL